MEENPRRTLSSIRNTISREMQHIQDTYNFDLENGTAQLGDDTYLIRRAFNYGRYDALRDLLEDLS